MVWRVSADVEQLVAAYQHLLPRFSLDEMRRCTRSDGDVSLPRAKSFSECVNLAPAGTASVSLHYSLIHTSPEFHGWPRNHSQMLPGHAHSYDVSAFRERARELRLPEPKCFIMTIREPVARWQSYLRESFDKRGRASRALAGNRTMDAFMDQLRTPDSLVAHMYRQSAFNGTYMDWHHQGWGPGNVGSHGLVSQALFLRGLDCSRAEVHFVCADNTDTFFEDWQALVKQFTPWTNGTVDKPARTNRRRSGYKGTTTMHRPEDRDLFRNKLFAWDTSLHAMVCGAGGIAPSSRLRAPNATEQ